MHRPRSMFHSAQDAAKFVGSYPLLDPFMSMEGAIFVSHDNLICSDCIQTSGDINKRRLCFVE